ncbi:MAG: trypsin-like peptidase domain-containing protein [Verrucomicrobia bacterium]|nr:trypsin-like peptidase domain-containing protein [Verrucomicrobiota bacterium]
MKAFLPIASLLLSLAPCSLINLGAYTASEIVTNAQPAVVKIIAVDAKQEPYQTSTGFFITDDGVLVTNNHVTAGAADLLAQTSTGAIYIFRSVIFRSASLDLALLKFAATGVPHLRLGSAVHVVEGQRIVVIARPEGLQTTVSAGIISALRDDRSSMQITAAISPGSSGAPVLDESGQVIGIANPICKDGGDQNCAIAAETLKLAFLAGAELPANNQSQEIDPIVKFPGIHLRVSK